ncbi:MAG: hypothetical protein K0R84_1194 [Clostridia bacterium]|jgi:hypothetical protein|nr:hypothetical protein [Clostridia bacterium]
MGECGDDKIAAILGEVYKNKDTGISGKRDTNLMLEIDLSSKVYKIIELQFVPQGISIYSGLCFKGENILMCQAGYLCDEKEPQCIIEVDKEGNFIDKYDIYEEQGIYNIQVSPDNKKISYQAGQTPVDLYVYDIEKNSRLQIFKSDAANTYSYCIYSAWSREENTLYYITLDADNYYLHKYEF